MSSAESNPAYTKGIVRIFQGEQVIGTGFHIAEGYVLTCAHVVVRALQLRTNYKVTSAPAVADAEVTIQFPLVESQPSYPSQVLGQLWRVANDDIAVLKLREELDSEILPSPIEPLGNAYQGHSFQILGFSDRSGNGVWTRGRIAGEVAGNRIQLEGAEPNQPDIQPGFSGAPVWNEELETIVGMVSQNVVERDEDFEEHGVVKATKRSFMIPYRNRIELALQEINVRILLDILAPHTESVRHYIQEAYDCYVRPSGSSEDYPGDLAEILRAANQQKQLCTIIACLLLPIVQISEELREDLERWLQTQDADLLSLKETVKLRFQPRSPQAFVDCLPHLLFWVRGELNQTRYSVQALLIRDERKYEAGKAGGCELIKSANPEDDLIPAHNLKDSLLACLEEIRKYGISIDQHLTIHLFLPIELLNEPVDTWEAEPTSDDPLLAIIQETISETIGFRCQVVLRSSERMHQKLYQRFWQHWEKRWENYQKLKGQSAHQRLLSAQKATGEMLEGAQLQGVLGSETYVGLYVMQSPPILNAKVPWITVQFCSFAPVITLWSRQTSTSDACKTQFEELVCCSLDKLSKEIHKTRIVACGKNKDEYFGHHLALMWENPHLIPPEVAKWKKI